MLKEKVLRLTKLRYETLPLLIEQMQISAKQKQGDPVSQILKCHLLSEVLLDKLLALALEPNGEAVLSAQLRYAQKLDIASRSVLTEGFSVLPDFVVASLRQLNKIRNRLAHELGATVTKEDAVSLFSGSEPPPTIDLAEADVVTLIYHYTPYIFGNMLPKYEDHAE